MPLGGQTPKLETRGVIVVQVSIVGWKRHVADATVTNFWPARS